MAAVAGSMTTKGALKMAAVAACEGEDGDDCLDLGDDNGEGAARVR